MYVREIPQKTFICPNVHGGIQRFCTFHYGYHNCMGWNSDRIGETEWYICCLLVDFHDHLTVIVYHFPGALLCPHDTNTVLGCEVLPSNDRSCLVTTNNEFLCERMTINIKRTLSEPNRFHTCPSCRNNKRTSILC